jgi:hypothetical protein
MTNTRNWNQAEMWSTGKPFNSSRRGALKLVDPTQMVLCFNMISHHLNSVKQKLSFCQYELLAWLNHLCEHRHSQLLQLLSQGLFLYWNNGWRCCTNESKWRVTIQTHFLGLDVQWVGNSNEPSCLYSLATILFGTGLWNQSMSLILNDIAHATINRKDIYSLLNNAAWPRTWIQVSDCNSISLNDMVP